MDVFLSYKDLIKHTSAEIEKLRNSNIPIGLIVPYGGNTIPSGWLECNGMAVNRVVYAQLFSVIGTIYGEGDGSTTFNLPNISGKTLVGRDTNDTSFDVLGETGGEKTHTLTTAEMPSHTHTTQDAGSHTHRLTNKITSIPIGTSNYYGVSPDGYSYDKDDDSVTQSAGTHKHTVNSTGGGGAHNNMPPYLVTRYIIKAVSNPEDTPVSPTIEQRIAALEAQMSVDTIVSQGTSGIWTWRKWSNGIAECWGVSASTSRAFTTTSGYGYYLSFDQSLPSGLFKNITYADANRCGGTTGNYLLTACVRSYTTSSLSVFLWGPASGTASVAMSYIVKGRWK